MGKRDGRSISDIALETMRYQAIDAYEKKVSVVAIAKMFQLHRGSVSRWITKWKREGKESLKRRISSGRPRKLDCRKYGRKILRIVRSSAMDHGYENPLWNCRRLRRVLKRELKLSLSVSSLWEALKRMKLSAQKPERRALEQDPVRRKAWVEIELPKIRKLASREGALIFYEDEACVRLTPTVGTTWAPIGQTPIIRVTGKRASVCVMSAVQEGGRLFFKIPTGKVNSEVFIDFLNSLCREYPKRMIFVIADQASSHTAKKVKAFVKKHPRLRLFYLPPYSPDFNPDEEAWNHLKNNELKAHQKSDKSGLRRATLHSLRRMKRRPSLIRSFFKQKCVA